MNTQRGMKTKSGGDLLAALFLVLIAPVSAVIIVFGLSKQAEQEQILLPTKEWECKLAFVRDTEKGLERECVMYKKKGMDFDGYGSYKYRKYDSETGTLLYPKEKAQ